jgi:hypothetical protein
MWQALHQQLGGACVRLDPLVSELMARVQRVYFLDEMVDMAR